VMQAENKACIDASVISVVIASISFQ
jgi:hypothetical protein